MQQNEVVKRLMWSGVLAAFGAAFSVVSQRAAAVFWRRVFHEEPPQ